MVINLNVLLFVACLFLRLAIENVGRTRVVVVVGGGGEAPLKRGTGANSKKYYPFAQPPPPTPFPTLYSLPKFFKVLPDKYLGFGSEVVKYRGQRVALSPLLTRWLSAGVRHGFKPFLHPVVSYVRGTIVICLRHRPQRWSGYSKNVPYGYKPYS